MTQQIIALILIAIFIWRLFSQKNKKKIKKNEFILWLIFWTLGALAIIFIHNIDSLVRSFGFSGTGISFLIYFAVLILFYLIFRLRLNLAKLEENITELTRKIALDDNNINNDNKNINNKDKG